MSKLDFNKVEMMMVILSFLKISILKMTFTDISENQMPKVALWKDCRFLPTS